MTETDRLFLEQNTIEETVKLTSIESHLTKAKYIKFCEFMRGQTITINKEGETIIFLRDIERFLNNYQ